MTSVINDAVLLVSDRVELSILVKATILLALGLTAARLAGRGRASVRHLILAMTFAMAAALPVIVAMAPGVTVEVPVPRESGIGVPVDGAAASVAAPMAARGNVVGRSPESSGWMMPSWPATVRFVWASGAMLLLMPLTMDLWRLRRLRRDGLPWPELRGRVRLLAAERGVRRDVEVLWHEDVPAPLTCGWWRPAIVLPLDARSWDDVELRCALVHELEHVRRGDWAIHLAARVVCACYWFHPLAWAAWRRLCLEAERACDDAVVQREEHTLYAEQLVSLAQRMSKTHAQPALGMANRSDLATRVSALLDSGQRRGRVGIWAAACAVVGAVLVVLAVGPVRAVAQSPGRGNQVSRPSALDRSLFDAAESGDVAAIDRLVASGAKVNSKLDGDGSALIAAARKGHNEAVRLLLDYDANPNMGVGGDGSPLIVAAQHGHLATVRLLLDRGADIHMPVLGDGNPLIMAARGGHVDVVQFLLDRGANIEQVVPGDENALIEASASGHLPVAKLLVGRGANINARVWAESNGIGAGEWRTPLNMARRRGHAAVVAYLQSAGARE